MTDFWGFRELNGIASLALLARNDGILDEIASSFASLTPRNDGGFRNDGDFRNDGGYESKS